MGLFDWLRGKSKPKPVSTSTLVNDASRMSDQISKALNQSGYKADFSLESLREIDRFFDEQSHQGEALPGGLLSEQLGARVFALGSYVGECIIRHYGGKWQADDTDPEGENQHRSPNA
jgi:hypothetical protein